MVSINALSYCLISFRPVHEGKAVFLSNDESRTVEWSYLFRGSAHIPERIKAAEDREIKKNRFSPLKSGIHLVPTLFLMFMGNAGFLFYANRMPGTYTYLPMIPRLRIYLLFFLFRFIELPDLSGIFRNLVDPRCIAGASVFPETTRWYGRGGAGDRMAVLVVVGGAHAVSRLEEDKKVEMEMSSVGRCQGLLFGFPSFYR